MALAKLYNLARVTTTTTGVGTITLGAAVPGALTFADAGVQDGDIVSYGIKDSTASEVGRGTYSSSGPTLTRTTVLKSTTGGSAINLTGNNAEVFITALAEDFDFTGNLAGGFWSSSDVASASTCDIGAVAAPIVRITGTTTISSLGSATNKIRLVRFAGALTLTYNATSLILPGFADIRTAADDQAEFVSDSSGNWRCTKYQRAGNTPAAIAGSIAFRATKNGDQTGIANSTDTQVTGWTEVFDDGSCFASDGWTPPAGKVIVGAMLFGSGSLTAGNQTQLRIYKNGAVYQAFIGANATNVPVVQGELVDKCNGTDVYTFVARVSGITSGTATISSAGGTTAFWGVWLGP